MSQPTSSAIPAPASPAFPAAAWDADVILAVLLADDFEAFAAVSS